MFLKAKKQMNLNKNQADSEDDLVSHKFNSDDKNGDNCEESSKDEPESYKSWGEKLKR